MYRKIQGDWKRKIHFIALDILCMELSFIFATWLRNESFQSFVNGVTYRSVLFILALLDFIIIVFYESYQDIIKRTAYEELISLSKQTTTLVLFLALVLQLTKTAGEFSRMVFFGTTLIYMTLNYLSRLIYKWFMKTRKATNAGRVSLFIITTKAELERTIASIIEQNYSRYEIKGIAVTDADLVGEEAFGIRIVSNRSSIIDFITGDCIDEVAVNVPGADQTVESICDMISSMGIVVHRRLMIDRESLHDGQKIEHIGNSIFVTNYMRGKRIRE